MTMQLSRTCRCIRAPAVRRVSGIRVVKVRAETTETAEPVTDVPSAVRTRKRNSASFTGYTDNDTYGQTNIFPVEVGIVEVGSAKDTVEDSSAGTVAAAAAFAAVAAVVIIGGVFATSKGPASPGVEAAEDFSQYLTLTQYSAKFAAELPPASALFVAPAVAVEAAAPVAAAE